MVGLEKDDGRSGNYDRDNDDIGCQQFSWLATLYQFLDIPGVCPRNPRVVLMSWILATQGD